MGFPRVGLQIGGKSMSNPNFRRETSGEKNRARKETADIPGDALTEASRAASDAAGKASQVASDAASSITDQVKGLLDEQVGNGANMVGHLAGSAMLAADDLHRNAPQLAGLLQGVAHRLESYADDLHGQSVDELWRSASNYTRRQPAVVFGLAALVGFFALRTLKSTSVTPTAKHSQQQHGQFARAGGFYDH
jgi:hypothetical protein